MKWQDVDVALVDTRWPIGRIHSALGVVSGPRVVVLPVSSQSLLANCNVEKRRENILIQKEAWSCVRYIYNEYIELWFRINLNLCGFKRPPVPPNVAITASESTPFPTLILQVARSTIYSHFFSTFKSDVLSVQSERFSLMSLFRVTAMAALARGPCWVKW